MGGAIVEILTIEHAGVIDFVNRVLDLRGRRADAAHGIRFQLGVAEHELRGSEVGPRVQIAQAALSCYDLAGLIDSRII